MERTARITINTDRLELDLIYKIENSRLSINYLWIANQYYWQPKGIDDEINADHIREMMGAIKEVMWNRDFVIELIAKIPFILQQYNRKDLAAVALDFLKENGFIKDSQNRL